MHLLVLDFLKVVFKDEAQSVILPCADGEMGILDFHQPFICSLKAGFLKIFLWQGAGKEIRVNKGIAKMKENSLVILIGGEESGTERT